MSKLRAPRGTQDVFGENMRTWKRIEETARELCDLYHVSEIKTPIFEHTEVFDRGNDASDVVNKEMYTFEDRGGRSLTLKPEGTAGVVRAFVEHKLYAKGNEVQRYFYISPNFRYERPQKGRMRMHYQFGVEYFGDKNPYVDVEGMMLGLDVLNQLGLKDYKLVINTLGDQESQDTYRKELIKHFEPFIDELGEDNQRRFKQNPLRILDDKFYQDHIALKTAPTNRDSLNEESLSYFKKVCEILDTQGIDYEIDPKLVRGLDYYHHTVFEVISTDEKAGAQSTIFAGGRYDHLVKYYGGPDMSAFGFGMGLERIMVFLELAGIDLAQDDTLDVFVMPLDPLANDLGFETLMTLRNLGYVADMDFTNRSMRAQFKLVDRYKAKAAIILGDKEVEENVLTIKNIETQEQVSIKIEELDSLMEKWIGANKNE